MSKVNKTMVTCFMAFTFFMCSFSHPCSGKGDVDITWKGEALSADFVRVPLRGILERLHREKGIWFKVPEPFIEKEISVRFKELTFEEALKRILVPFDYSLVFDINRRPVGVVIVGNKTPLHAKGKRPAAGPSAGKTEPEHPNNASKSTNNLSPGGPVTVSPEELEMFKVIKNCPPPGGVVEVTEEELEKFKVIKNCPPPGGAVTVSPKELDKFKVIKNCPPPGS